MTSEVLTERNCGNCIHWRRAPIPGALKPTGYCYRFPPKVAVIAVQGTPMGPQALTNGFRPPVPADEPPCGEHQSHHEQRMVPLDWNRWQEEPPEVIEVVDEPIELPTFDQPEPIE